MQKRGAGCGPAPRRCSVLTMVSQVSSQHIQKFTIRRWTLERRSGDMFQKLMIGTVPYCVDQITNCPLHSGAGRSELACSFWVKPLCDKTDLCRVIGNLFNHENRVLEAHQFPGYAQCTQQAFCVQRLFCHILLPFR